VLLKNSGNACRCLQNANIYVAGSNADNIGKPAGADV
jgi:hypothetical protein